MKSLVAAVIAGVLAGVVAYWLSIRRADQAITSVDQEVSARLDEMMARIDQLQARAADILHIRMSGGPAACRSETVLRGRVKQHERVVWRIADPSPKCLGNGNRLRLVFANNSVVVPAQPEGDRDIEATAVGPFGTHKYEVWLISADGSARRLEDPELDITPP